MEPIFSVIIPTYKRHEALTACLKNIDEAAQNMPPGTVEILVSDDYNAADTQSYLFQFGFASNISLIDGPKKGPAANRNNGARMSKGKWLIFVDDDCLPDKDIIRNYFKGIEQYPDFTVFNGKIINDRPQTRYDEEAPYSISETTFTTCNFCVKKEAFYQIGGFDEAFPFPYMEDIDFYVALEKKEIKMKFIDDAFVIHPWRPKRGWLGYKKNLKSTLYFFKKNYEYLKPRKLQYFKIFFGGFKSRFSKLIKLKGRGAKDFIQENIYYFILAFRFYFLKK